MNVPLSDVAFTPTVKDIQRRLGSRGIYESMENRGGWTGTITAELAEFIAARDTVFLATVNAEGQPYIQHRGGPRGFLQVVDDTTLGFVDYPGNRQYISMGNLHDNARAFLFLMDFARRQRIKVWGHAEVIEDDPELLERLRHPDQAVPGERVFLFHVDAWDRNCPQHITPRFDADEVEEMVRPLRDRIRDLERRLQSSTAPTSRP